MRTLSSAICVFLVTHVAAQQPVKTIEDGVLDRIELFVATIEGAAERPVLVKAFDASAADLGTGGKDGKEVRRQEAQTMKNEGPRVLAERFVASLEKGGPFRTVRILKPDEAVPDGALVRGEKLE